MEDTYNVKAIILNRRALGESDGRVTAYSREAGKLELTVRGMKKPKSKLAAHLEPLNLTNIMVVRGQKHDYVGAAMSENCYPEIKNDLAKLAAAGRALKITGELIKPGLADERIFELLKDYLLTLEASKNGLEVLAPFFVFKLLAELGHQPELFSCLACSKKISPGKNKFDLAKGGLVCDRCAKPGDSNQLVISDDGIKLLRLALKTDFKQLAKVKVGGKLCGEAGGVIDKFSKYCF